MTFLAVCYNKETEGPYRRSGGLIFQARILAKAAPVMRANAFQLKTVTVTNACVERDFMGKIAKKVLILRI